MPTVLNFIPGLGGGGAERQLTLLAPGLQRRGWTVHVAYAADGPHEAALKTAGVLLRRVGDRRLGTPAALARSVALARSLRPDIVQTWLPHMDIVGGIAALTAGCRWVLAERSGASAYKHGAMHRVRGWLGSRASLVIANSQGGAEYWQTLTARVPCLVIRNGVERAEHFPRPHAESPTVNMLRGSTRRWQLIYAGRLAVEKNVENLARAIERLGSNRSDVDFHLYGEGPLEGAVRTLVGELAAERVTLHSYSPLLTEVLANADAFVSVSHFEGNPNTVLEAAALGCPLVLSDIAPHREMFDESAVLFVDPNSVVSIAAGLDYVLRDRRSAEARARQAFEIVGRFGVDEMVSAYDRAYARLLRGSPMVALDES